MNRLVNYAILFAMASNLSPMEPLAARRTAGAVWDQVTKSVQQNGMTERQRLLNWCYAH